MTNDMTVRAGEQRAPATLDEYAHNLAAKLEMAKILLGSGLLPQHLKTPQAVLTAILYGQELGFSPLQSCQSITVIQGKPTVDAAGLQALAQAAGGRVELLEHTDKLCRLKVWRGKDSQEANFTWDEAVSMGLAAKDNWKRMPKDMLYARAVSRGVRRMFADSIKGFYSTEEMRDSTQARDAEPPAIETKVIEAASAVAGLKTADELPPKPAKQPARFFYDASLEQDMERQALMVEWFESAEAEEKGIRIESSMLYSAPKRLPARFKRFEVSGPRDTVIIRDEKGAPTFVDRNSGEIDDLAFEGGPDNENA